ncbi:hypothetical protein D3C80_535130 [compost metagenome]
MATSISQRFEKAGDFYLLDDVDLRGGFRVVTSLAERDAIPLPARKQGMVVRVLDKVAGTTVNYELPFGKPITNANWIEWKVGAGGDFIPTAGGNLDGELKLGAAASFNFDDALKAEIVDRNLLFSPVGTFDPDDPEPQGLMAFGNNTENTIEINPWIGQIVCKTEVALASDRSLKTDIKRIENAMKILRRMHGYTFQKIGNPDRLFTGLIAQEVAQVFPEAVCHSTDGKLAVYYGSFAGLFVECLTDVDERLIALEKRLDALEEKGEL